MKKTENVRFRFGFEFRNPSPNRTKTRNIYIFYPSQILNPASSHHHLSLPNPPPAAALSLSLPFTQFPSSLPPSSQPYHSVPHFLSPSIPPSPLYLSVSGKFAVHILISFSELCCVVFSFTELYQICIFFLFWGFHLV